MVAFCWKSGFNGSVFKPMVIIYRGPEMWLLLFLQFDEIFSI